MFRIGVAIFASAGLIALTIALEGSAPPGELTYIPSDSPDSTPSFGIAEHIYTPSMLEIVLQIGAILVGLGGVSILTSRAVRGFRVLLGSIAAVTSGLLALAILRASVQGSVPLAVFPSIRTIFFVVAIAALIGSVSAWLALRWWPNPSLERP